MMRIEVNQLSEEEQYLKFVELVPANIDPDTLYELYKGTIKNTSINYLLKQISQYDGVKIHAVKDPKGIEVRGYLPVWINNKQYVIDGDYYKLHIEFEHAPLIKFNGFKSEWFLSITGWYNSEYLAMLFRNLYEEDRWQKNYVFFGKQDQLHKFLFEVIRYLEIKDIGSWWFVQDLPNMIQHQLMPAQINQVYVAYNQDLGIKIIGNNPLEVFKLNRFNMFELCLYCSINPNDKLMYELYMTKYKQAKLEYANLLEQKHQIILAEQYLLEEILHRYLYIKVYGLIKYIKLKANKQFWNILTELDDIEKNDLIILRKKFKLKDPYRDTDNKLALEFLKVIKTGTLEAKQLKLVELKYTKLCKHYEWLLVPTSTLPEYMIRINNFIVCDLCGDMLINDREEAFDFDDLSGYVITDQKLNSYLLSLLMQVLNWFEYKLEEFQRQRLLNILVGSVFNYAQAIENYYARIRTMSSEDANNNKTLYCLIYLFASVIWFISKNPGVIKPKIQLAYETDNLVLIKWASSNIYDSYRYLIKNSPDINKDFIKDNMVKAISNLVNANMKLNTEPNKNYYDYCGNLMLYTKQLELANVTGNILTIMYEHVKHFADLLVGNNTKQIKDHSLQFYFVLQQLYHMNKWCPVPGIDYLGLIWGLKNGVHKHQWIKHIYKADQCIDLACNICGYTKQDIYDGKHKDLKLAEMLFIDADQKYFWNFVKRNCPLGGLHTIGCKRCQYKADHDVQYYEKHKHVFMQTTDITYETVKPAIKSVQLPDIDKEKSYAVEFVNIHYDHIKAGSTILGIKGLKISKAELSNLINNFGCFEAELYYDCYKKILTKPEHVKQVIIHGLIMNQLKLYQQLKYYDGSSSNHVLKKLDINASKLPEFEVLSGINVGYLMYYTGIMSSERAANILIDLLLKYWINISNICGSDLLVYMFHIAIKSQEITCRPNEKTEVAIKVNIDEPVYEEQDVSDMNYHKHARNAAKFNFDFGRKIMIDQKYFHEED
jgi:hypothetical protein